MVDLLLDYGCFIDTNPSDATTAAQDPTLNKREPIKDQQSAAPATSYGVSESATTPEKPSKPPSAMPVKNKVMNSTATAGMVDKSQAANSDQNMSQSQILERRAKFSIKMGGMGKTGMMGST